MIEEFQNRVAFAEEVLPPCQFRCPLHQDARGYIACIAQGRLDDAIQLIRETNPLACICSGICAHPCEDECRRRNVDKPLSIRGLKRFVIENAGKDVTLDKIAPEKDKKVAIIGAGPAGLTAAHDLALMGYKVTLFEKEDGGGGMVRHVIPEYRLPMAMINRDVENIKALGVEIKAGMELGKGLSIDDLEKQGYEAILLATGLPDSRGIPIPGADFEGVLLALPFLKAAKKGNSLIKKGSEVIVIGGGNVAMDVARTAHRFGAKAVRLVCLESQDEMPASPWEIEEAAEEGVEVNFCSKGPKEIMISKKKIIGLECKECLSVFDDQKRFSPTFDDTCITMVPGDTVIMAIGQGANISYLKDMGIDLNERGQLLWDRVTHATNRKGVFTCGEVSTGPGLAVAAMASGRKAAMSVATYLEGGVFTPPQYPISMEALVDSTVEKVKHQDRNEVPLLDVKVRHDNFVPIEIGYDECTAIKEARRCLSCGAGARWIRGKCVYCLTCVRVCPYDVPVVTPSGIIDIRFDQCQACGICYTACPANAIEFAMPGVQELSNRMEAALQQAGPGAILALYCDFGACDGSKLRSMMKEKHPKAALVSIPCIAKISINDLIMAFELGADGVLVAGCGSDDCVYQNGELWGQCRVDAAKVLLVEAGLEAARLHMHYVDGLQVDEFNKVLSEFTSKIADLSSSWEIS